MFWRLTIAAIALATVTPQAQTRSPFAGQSRPPQGAVIIGEVIDAASGRGVNRAIVRLRGANVSQVRVTDNRGRYYFTGLPRGEFQLTATREGYFDGEYGRLRAGGEGLPVYLGSGEWLTEVRIDLWRPAVIHGVVVDEANEPVIAVRVHAHRRTYIENREQLIASGSELTDDQGTYRLAGLLPGDYVVSVPQTQISVPVETVERIAQTGSTGGVGLQLNILMGIGGALSARSHAVLTTDGSAIVLGARNATPPPADGGNEYAYPTQYYPAAPVASRALIVSVRAGEERSGVTFQLRPVLTRQISGRVTDDAGPVANQLLRLLNEDAEIAGVGTETAMTISKPDGTFAFVDVPPGRYVVDTRDPQYLVSSTPLAQMRDSTALVDMAAEASRAQAGTAGQARQIDPRWGRASVEVASRHVTGLEIVLLRGATVSGRLVFDGAAERPASLASVPVLLEPVSDRSAAVPPSRLSAAGFFVFAAVMPGTYAIRLGAPIRGWTVRSITADGRDVTSSEFSVGDGASPASVLITLSSRGAKLTGYVRDTKAQYVRGATIVVLTPTSTGSFRIRSGRAPMLSPFVIDALPAGEHFVVAMDERTAEGWQAPDRIRDLRARAMRVVLRETDVRLLDLTLR